ncbi:MULTISPECIES: Mor transcription activator family protein [Marichromatium]|nr:MULTISPECIES: Mor transcription activator family protein [Marichromatium]TCW32673.1 Mor transcription activator family protein [Marichromatium gracile]
MDLADTLEGVALQTLAPLLEREQALLAAEQIAAALLDRYRGSQVYVGSAAAIERRRRDRAIADEYDGTVASARALARRYDIHEMSVYRIVARAKGRERADRRAR